jgi:hypothetical protein
MRRRAGASGWHHIRRAVTKSPALVPPQVFEARLRERKMTDDCDLEFDSTLRRARADLALSSSGAFSTSRFERRRLRKQ